jgi:type VI secretion system secreted protein Hcp
MAVDMFLKLTDVTGESADDKHKEWIDILAWSWGESQSATGHTGTGSGAGKVSAQDLSVTKYVDNASGTLLTFCANGKHVAEGKLIVRKAGEKPLEYIKYTMKDILISAVSTGGSGGEDRLTENVTLNFAEVKFEYQKQDKTGAGQAGSEFAWNFAKNVKA